MKTVPATELSSLKMTTGNEKRFTIVIDGDDVKEWVGIGWITLHKVTAADRRKYPIVKR